MQRKKEHQKMIADSLIVSIGSDVFPLTFLFSACLWLRLLTKKSISVYEEKYRTRGLKRECLISSSFIDSMNVAYLNTVNEPI